MNEYLRISLLIAILLYYVFIFHLLKKDSLNLKYTLLWLLTGLVLLITVLFPVVLKYPLKKMGVVEWTNGIFALVLFFLILICITITSIVSKLNDRNRKLTQKCALYEKRIRELEKKVFGEDIKETDE
ncbi:DUF2304 domain-containing protein [Eubacterium uniforme]|uniref:DUF2304 domain-containing protein n=1 Tax=Eubacterium uniforme TaxID=39495 RepID=A0A1T4VCF5_9FIRM|nr:DUF2304 domain-containing protein [Eubacterium uniforme]SKA62593.1 hypothetical protein SAMN02745111_00653 [Eubacterium uniforme]HAH17547.1 DUF2304 domain-containing protein [Eubacterium sp.]HAV89816.1 DUF2304 domain-containing protein [Eubacterium sp.]